MAEVIKYGVIFDKAFFEFLRDNEAKDNLEYVITRCVELKRDIVNADEKEKRRQSTSEFRSYRRSRHRKNAADIKFHTEVRLPSEW